MERYLPSRRTLALIIPAILLYALAARAADADLHFHTYPNPFVPGAHEARLSYFLPSGGTVSIRIYDLEGNLVRTLVDGGKRTRGQHDGEEKWDGADENDYVVDPGPYVIVLEVRIAGEVYRDTSVAVVNW